MSRRSISRLENRLKVELANKSGVWIRNQWGDESKVNIKELAKDSLSNLDMLSNDDDRVKFLVRFWSYSQKSAEEAIDTLERIYNGTQTKDTRFAVIEKSGMVRWHRVYFNSKNKCSLCHVILFRSGAEKAHKKSQACYALRKIYKEIKSNSVITTFNNIELLKKAGIKHTAIPTVWRIYVPKWVNEAISDWYINKPYNLSLEDYLKRLNAKK